MTHHGDGHISIRPALDPVERELVRALAEIDGTLRGTPTGRGDPDVPFARMAWEPCANGCCLRWVPGREATRMMLPTLRFLIDHLLGPGAKAEGREGFADLTCDHVLTGCVVGPGRIIEVVGNVATERMVEPGCDPSPVARGSRAPRRLPENVIAFRPRHA